MTDTRLRTRLLFRLIIHALAVAHVTVATLLYAQVETVPVSHPVYLFLKRMEVKGNIERYHDAILPLSRKEVGKFLTSLHEKSADLTGAERGYLADYLSEFQYDVRGTTEGFQSLIDPGSAQDASHGQLFSNREKFLYAYADTNLSFFVNALLTFDARGISGDALGSQHAEFVQFGGRVRGTIYQDLGYYLQGTNAQFWGSRSLLGRDRLISQSHAHAVTDAQNFDFSEGYVRYGGGILSAQLGRERLLWGNGYDQKMILSDNPRVFDFIRADAQYKSLKYTFLHGWLLGTQSSIVFTLPSDTAAKFIEPVASDKYIAAHRIEFSFPRLFDIGAQEMVIYSNRAPDLAYLNPLVVFESTQRSRGERDNVFWVFDIQTHFFPGLELHGTILFDDIHFAQFFEPRWYNRYAYQVGLFLTDPLMLPDLSLMAEYTRVEPYVFAHDRSRDNNYGSLGSLLGTRIQPNADSWFFRADYLPERNLSFSLRLSLTRHGENILDAGGRLIKNVGGNFLQGHRPSDPEDKTFLDGNLVKTQKVEFFGTYEVVNQIWLDGWYEFESVSNASAGTTLRNHTYGARARLEF